MACALYFWWAYGEVLEHPWHFNDDVVQHYLWLFDVDWADDYYARTSRAIQPLGFRALLSGLSLVAEPLVISRYGPLLVTLVNVGFTAAILRRYYPLVFAAAAALLIGHVCLTMTMGFLARACCAPLLLAFGYYLVRGDRPRALGFILVLSALFYPPALLINGGIGGLWFLVDTIRKRKIPWQWWPAAVGALAGLGVALLQSWLIRSNPDLGEMMTWKTMRWMPEFSSGGRVDFRSLKDLPSFRYFRYFFGFYLPLGEGRWFAYGMLGTFLMTALIRWRSAGKLTGWLLAWVITTVILYQLAKELVPALFLPDRYITYPWRPLAALLLVVCTGWFVIRWPNRWLSAALGTLLLAYGVYYKTPDRVGMVRAEQEKEFYDAISALPDTVMLAGPPVLMSHVPLLTRRFVLITNEGAHALYFEGFYDYVTPRLADQMIAYAAPADSISLVINFARQYGVDYLVVQPEALREGRARTFNPHAKWFKERTEGRDPDDFALLTVPDSVRIEVDGGKYFLVKVEDLE